MNFDKYSYNVAEALTPIDGRNRHKLQDLIPHFSELTLDKYRILVELKYLIQLSKYKLIRKINLKDHTSINRLIEAFDARDYIQIREIESRTNHDVKAVEEFIKQKLAKTSLRDVVEMVHFGLTSEDVNNIAWALMIKNALQKVIGPQLISLIRLIKLIGNRYKKLPMLGRTHGQPAVPTTVGKEFLVYFKRLDLLMRQLNNSKILAKLTGNIGNLNVHKFIYPQINWQKFSKEFIKSSGLDPDLVTTQIEPYDSYLQVFSILLRMNNILLGLCQDMWIYLMLGYFKQKVIKSEVGSTALPHKVNPIYFEGAEGGLGVANSLFEFYIRKLSYSRLQRDLSDSTVRRSWGIAFSYSLLSYQSILEALNRIEPDEKMLKEDLNNHWEVLSEAIQNFLRVKGYKNAYGQIKKTFRGKTMNEKEFKKEILKFKIGKNDKEKLLKLSPEKYTGYAQEII